MEFTTFPQTNLWSSHISANDFVEFLHLRKRFCRVPLVENFQPFSHKQASSGIPPFLAFSCSFQPLFWSSAGPQSSPILRFPQIFHRCVFQKRVKRVNPLCYPSPGIPARVFQKRWPPECSPVLACPCNFQPFFRKRQPSESPLFLAFP